MNSHQRHPSTGHGSSRRRVFRMSTVVPAAALALGLGFTLSGCGPTPAVSPTAAGTTASASAPATAGPSASSSMSATPTSSTQPALCKAASLTGSIDDSGGGAAGHIYMKLIVKNTSSTTCILDGYPGVSMVKAGTDTPIGAPAVRNDQAPSTGPITLAAGQSSAAVLAYTQSGVYQNCTHVPADSILVYPPSATDHLEITHPLDACSNADIMLLSIGAFQP